MGMWWCICGMKGWIPTTSGRPQSLLSHESGDDPVLDAKKRDFRITQNSALSSSKLIKQLKQMTFRSNFWWHSAIFLFARGWWIKQISQKNGNRTTGRPLDDSQAAICPVRHPSTDLWLDKLGNPTSFVLQYHGWIPNPAFSWLHSSFE